MKAILINAEEKTITEIDYSGDYKEIYELIDCQTFTCVSMENGDAMFVDDEGLLTNPEHFIQIKDYHAPIAGSGLILGTGDEGESISCKHTIETIQDNVKFLNKFQVQLLCAM